MIRECGKGAEVKRGRDKVGIERMSISGPHLMLKNKCKEIWGQKVQERNIPY